MSQGTRVIAFVGVMLSLLSGSSALWAQAATPVEPPPVAVPATAAHPYAIVNGKSISQAEYQAAYVNYMRQKFYHGQVPEDQLVQARKDVGSQLIERLLLLEEIERRDIKPDSVDVEKQILGYDQRYATNPNWQKSRETMLPGLRQQLSQQSRLKRLEEAVRDIPPPGEPEVKAFYAARPELFTEPAKLRLYSILLAVAPSSSNAVWEAARREGEAIVRRIRGGADFSEQARMASNDPSAESGGDMGYLHQGMLPESLQAKVDQFKVGEVADPIDMLQGIGIFRVDERIPPKLQDYERVAERARDLLHRERREKAWTDFLEALKREARITIIDAPGAATGAK